MEADQHADDVRKEDLQIKVFRRPSPLPGPSVVRITHLPTGIVVTSDEHSSSLQAKDQAVKELRRQLANQPTAVAGATSPDFEGLLGSGFSCTCWCRKSETQPQQYDGQEAS